MNRFFVKSETMSAATPTTKTNQMTPTTPDSRARSRTQWARS
jgi:hypothetical protein